MNINITIIILLSYSFIFSTGLCRTIFPRSNFRKYSTKCEGTSQSMRISMAYILILLVTILTAALPSIESRILDISNPNSDILKVRKCYSVDLFTLHNITNNDERPTFGFNHDFDYYNSHTNTNYGLHRKLGKRDSRITWARSSSFTACLDG